MFRSGVERDAALRITERRFGITERRLMPKVTSKGQVTIPKPLRDQLGLKPESSVEFELAGDGRVSLVASRPPPKSKFARLRASARSRMTTDEIMALTRGEDGG
jgi:AbrB family looped-hinge helix DNA binding protein